MGSFSLWHFFFLACVVLEGINGQVNGWLNAHATFYGANQSPTTLGKSHDVRSWMPHYYHFILYLSQTFILIYYKLTCMNNESCLKL
jgi:hypothetical protein